MGLESLMYDLFLLVEQIFRVEYLSGFLSFHVSWLWGGGRVLSFLQFSVGKVNLTFAFVVLFSDCLAWVPMVGPGLEDWVWPFSLSSVWLSHCPSSIIISDVDQQRLGTQSLGLYVNLFLLWLLCQPRTRVICFVRVSTGVRQLMATFHSLFSLLVSIVLLVLLFVFLFFPSFFLYFHFIFFVFR